VIVEIPIDRLVEIIVREVLAELVKRGVAIGSRPGERVVAPVADQAARVEIDMTGYRTPVLTESRVRALGRHVREIIVPAGTICTIGARDLLQQSRREIDIHPVAHRLSFRVRVHPLGRAMPVARDLAFAGGGPGSGAPRLLLHRR